MDGAGTRSQTQCPMLDVSTCLTSMGGGTGSAQLMGLRYIPLHGACPWLSKLHPPLRSLTPREVQEGG